MKCLCRPKEGVCVCVRHSSKPFSGKQLVRKLCSQETYSMVRVGNENSISYSYKCFEEK